MKTFEYNLYEYDEYNDDTHKSLGQCSHYVQAETEDDASHKLRMAERVLPSMRSELRLIK